MGDTRSFRRAEAGTVAVSFAISLIAIILCAGIAIDMARVYKAKNALQTALDAAVLAVGANSTKDQAAIAAMTGKYLAAGPIPNMLTLGTPVVAYNGEKNTVQVDLPATMKTAFMHIVGIETVDFNIRSKVERTVPGPLDLVLALDTTASMTEKNKIVTLKKVVTTLLDEVMQNKGAQVGIVPFSNYINVGTGMRGQPWLTIPDDLVTTGNCVYVDASGCVYGDSTCYNDGIPFACKVLLYCTTPGRWECQTVVRTWQGCVGARSEAFHASIASPTVNKYPGIRTGFGVSCGAVIQPLTTDRNVLQTAVNGLTPNGETHVPAGLLWGWNVLTPESPYTGGRTKADLQKLGGKKALVLMTDGSNTTSPREDGWYVSHASSPYKTGDYTDRLTSTLCENIKKDGVAVYTVLFAVSDANIERILRNCASDPNTMAFVANDDEGLAAAFKQIGLSLRKLRLVE